ncbi:transposase [Candidatus Saccharibacteria bacterium]|nr:transposase [Candidatus Saccharibacteria bacterium]
MPNNYHLLVYQTDSDGITSLTRRLVTSYSRYFNKKYNCTGPLFEDRFKASRISEDKYLMHISRYIHLNPARYNIWEFSSLPYYLGKKEASWVVPGKVLELFDGPKDYSRFLTDYKDYKKELDELKYQLANPL